MLPIERQQKILSWLKEEDTLRVSEISSRLEVSEMTIYRDIKPLIEANKVIKTSKGIAIVTSSPSMSTNTCTYCFKNINSRHNIHLIMKDHRVEQTCCAHCGLLRYDDASEHVSQIICKDFLLDTTISAKTAYFLINANIDIQCCKPQVLSFESREVALQFQKGFGGDIHSFQDIIQVISQDMNEGCCLK
ncbi:DeoR family transcriptional regulator [Ornithinibacillus xuwenensis]|uniref:DeoR family transcriptional regulator n=1 Tax=Ornithinibacillus xuwenensis TaxID=3144668 RepID=A0ABU9XGV4_9BACI